MRRRVQRRIAPDTQVVALVVLRNVRGPATDRQAGTVARYIERYGVTTTLGSRHPFGDQWLVLTEHRILLFAKRGGIVSRLGALEHELQRTDVDVQWADFNEATLHKRLIHLTTSDQRMNIGHTVVNNDEADVFVSAVGDRGREIGLQEL